MDSFGLVTYASLTRSITPLQGLLSCLKFTLDSGDLFCWDNRKIEFYELSQQHKQLKTMGWVNFDVILNIYINSTLNLLTKFTGSSRSTEFKVILPWNISQMITKTVPIIKKIVTSYAMKWDIPFLVCWKVNGNWDNNMIRISQ